MVSNTEAIGKVHYFSSNVLSFKKNGPNCNSFCFKTEVLVSKRRISFKTVYFYRPEANAN